MSPSLDPGLGVPHTTPQKWIVKLFNFFLLRYLIHSWEIRWYNQTKTPNSLYNQNHPLSPLLSSYLSLTSFYKTNLTFFYGYITNKPLIHK